MITQLNFIKDSLAPLANFRSPFINQINDFPSFAITDQKETKKHIGAGDILASITFTLRIYVYSAENSVDTLEDLIRSVEKIFDDIRKNFVNLHISYINTDAGLFSPYGIGEITCLVQYYEK